MRRIIGTFGATLAIVAALATTATAQAGLDSNPSLDKIRVTSVAAYANYADRDGLGDETQDPDLGLGMDWEEDWFEDYEEGDELDDSDVQVPGTDYATVTSIMGAFVPWAQASDKFV
jgi:hypothetical protein